MTQETQTYQERSRGFLVKAREELVAGDLVQASEKGWGAAALIVKAVAHHRGLSHSSHGLLIQTAYQLEEEMGEPGIRRLFDSATALHSNFYEGRMPLGAVEQRLNDVVDFVDIVERLLPGG